MFPCVVGSLVVSDFSFSSLFHSPVLDDCASLFSRPCRQYVNGETWPGVKASGRAPFGQAPFLEVTEADGSKWTLAQGHSIVRYILKAAGHGGSSARDEAIIDSLTERAMDYRARYGAAVPYTLGADEKKAKGQAWADEHWKSFSDNLDAFLAKSGSGFLVGSAVSAADVLWYTYLKALEATGVVLPLSDHLKKFFQTFEAQEKFKAFASAAYEINPANVPK